MASRFFIFSRPAEKPPSIASPGGMVNFQALRRQRSNSLLRFGSFTRAILTIFPKIFPPSFMRAPEVKPIFICLVRDNAQRILLYVSCVRCGPSLCLTPRFWQCPKHYLRLTCDSRIVGQPEPETLLFTPGRRTYRRRLESLMFQVRSNTAGKS